MLDEQTAVKLNAFASALLDKMAPAIDEIIKLGKIFRAKYLDEPFSDPLLPASRLPE